MLQDLADASFTRIHKIKVALPEHTMRVDLADALKVSGVARGVHQEPQKMQLTAGPWDTCTINVDPAALSYSTILRKAARIPSPLERARQRAQQYVDKCLRDPALSVDAIAARLNCTTRYLQKAFQETGQTLRDYIWHQRLNACYRDLIDPKFADINITDIALSWGFNSVTHFSDVFRKRFGLSPSAVRQKMTALSRTE